MNEPQVLFYASVTPSPPSKRGQGSLSLAAALVFPGLGHLLARRGRSAVRWIVTAIGITLAIVLAAIVPALFPLLVPLVVVQVIVNITVLPVSYLAGRRATSYVVPRPVLRYLLSIIVVVSALSVQSNVIVDFFRTRVVEAFVMPTSSISMSPTIQPSDRFVVHKLVQPRRWDVAAHDDPMGSNPSYVMRIVGLPGETVEIVEGRVHINGNPLKPPFPNLLYSMSKPNGGPINGPGCTGRPVTLGPDEYYLLGDNSPISGDARYWVGTRFGRQDGAIPAANIRGTATWIYWPPSRFGRIR